MKLLLPVLVLLAGVGGLLFVLFSQGENAGPDGGLPAAIERGETTPVNELGSTAAKAVGVYGKDGRFPAPKDDPDAWREVRFAPGGEGPVTGQVLLDVVSEHIPIRFINEVEMSAFRAHEFLPKRPAKEAVHHLSELYEWVRTAGYIAEDRGTFILLRKP